MLQLQLEERSEMKRNNSTDTKVSKEGEGGSVPGTRAEMALQPMMKTVVR